MARNLQASVALQQGEIVANILVIEDDIFTQQLLQAVLTSHGYDVHMTPSGEEGLRMFHTVKPDLVLLDIELPDMDGIQVCSRLVKLTNVPIIFVSAVTGEDNVIAGLEAGAIDYVTKPFSAKILLALIRANLRASSPARIEGRAGVQNYSDGYLVIDLEDRQVLVRGEKVKLTRTEFRLLSHLFVNAGRVCSFNELLDAVWGSEYRDSVDYLYTYIGRLRRKLEPDAQHPRYIVGDYGIGYWFEPLH